MTQCYHCGVEYKVKFDDDDATVQHCPSCGVDVDEAQSHKEQYQLDFGGDE